MGALSTKDTRRISFDNTFAISPPIAMSTCLENETNIIFDNLPIPGPKNELINRENNNEYQDSKEVDYWSQRMEYLKNEHQSINKIIESEYEKKLESTNQEFEPNIVTNERMQKVKPCFDWRTKILRCYEENPHQPLVCATIVQAFAKCVSNCRMEE